MIKRIGNFYHESLYILVKLILIALYIPMAYRFLNCFFQVKTNRLLFCSKRGNFFNCNPKYLFDYIQQLPCVEEYEYIWVVREVNKTKTKVFKNTIFVNYGTIDFLYYLLTSKVIIHNDGAFRFWSPSKEQLFVETWHGGGAYKKATLPINQLNPFARLLMRYSYPKHRTIILSSSIFFTKYFIKEDYLFHGTIINSGQPRNDIFFAKNISESVKKIKEKLNISVDSKILLYAPTWKSRVDNASVNVDFFKLQKALENRFDCHWVILQRSHSIQEFKTSACNVINVSKYPDMQELLLISDLLVSDYSSCIWDYSITRRPCVLFCSDLDDYLSHFNFYFDIKEWGFPIVKNNKELIEFVKKLDLEDQKVAMIKHMEFFGSFEKGNACKTVWQYLEHFIKNHNS